MTPLASPSRISPPGRLKAAAWYCAGLIISGMTHAESGDELAARLEKLGYEQGEPIERIEQYRVSGWNYLDDRHIVIYAGPSKQVLITTLAHCIELQSAENIGFTSTGNHLTRFDKIIVRGAGGIVQHCPISEIRSLQKTREHP